MSETATAPWDVAAISNLGLLTVSGDGSTSLVSLTHTCILGAFAGEHAQQGIPHVRLTSTMEQAAARDAGLEYDGSWPSWARSCATWQTIPR
ncbi:MAG TPA: hypothetical protein VEL76_39470 [Gemmataceae bacterium]|nr:hypothetical protein [Gemmataceae bacterium]